MDFPSYGRIMVKPASRFVALVAVFVMAAGACCCHGALLKELTRAKTGCCSEKSGPVHGSSGCQCSTQVLAEAKIVPSGVVPPIAAVGPVWLPVTMPSMIRFAPLRGVRLATAHAPPRRETLRLLQVWLI